MSRAWALENLDGSETFIRGQLDLAWDDGKPVELTTPRGLLDQQVRKCSIEQKRNLFDPRWGGDFDQQIGSKMLLDSGLRDIGEDLRAMIDQLVTIQREMATRLTLDPGELIVSIRSITLSTSGTTVRPLIKLATQAGGTDLAFTIG